jgi:SAM-dependent methyltransferase
MGIIGGRLGYRLLRAISRDGETGYCDGGAYLHRSKIEALWGAEIWREFDDKVVIDFGCGAGAEAIEIAQHGARQVIGLDVRESVLYRARRHAIEAGVGARCVFASETEEKADVLLSTDAFEHFDDPARVLRAMRDLLKPAGVAMIEFGPPWYHPLGGHLFSVFPWAHLLFTERALIRWRADFKSDGATRFSEVEGGLNQMTLRRFKQLVAASDFEFAAFEAVPIRSLRRLARVLPREFCTSVVRCRLVQKAAAHSAAQAGTKAMAH